MKTCERCKQSFGTLRKCVSCGRKVCGGCSWKSHINGKIVCTRGMRCVTANKRKALGCTHKESEPCVRY